MIGAAAFFLTSCTEAPSAPDVMSDLPGDTGQRSYGSALGMPTLECLTPVNFHTVEETSRLTDVEVTWSTNVAAELRAGTYRLAWFDNGGQAQGAVQRVEPLRIPLAYGEHQVTLALVTPDGSLVSAPTASCSIRVRVTRTCLSDQECADDYLCNTNTCVAQADGVKRCAFAPVPQAGCCQQSFECAFGQQCDTRRNQCVACTLDTHCDDGNACTTDSCMDGVCAASAADPTCCDCGASGIAPTTACNDGNACTVGSCNCAQKSCTFAARAMPDGAVCCDASQASACDDGDSATLDVCIKNVCRHAPQLDTAAAPAVDALEVPLAPQKAPLPTCMSAADGCLAGRIPASAATVRPASSAGGVTGPVVDRGAGTYTAELHALGAPNSSGTAWLSAGGSRSAPQPFTVHAEPPATVDAIVSATAYSDTRPATVVGVVRDALARPVATGTKVTVNAASEHAFANGECVTDAFGTCKAVLHIQAGHFERPDTLLVTAQAGTVTSRPQALALVPAPGAQTARALSVVLPVAPVWSGRTFDVPVVADSAHDFLGAWDAAIAYDAELLEVVAVTARTAGLQAPVWGAADGVLNMNGITSVQDLSGSVEVAVITFRATDAFEPGAVHGLGVTLRGLYDTDHNLLASAKSYGTRGITVRDAAVSGLMVRTDRSRLFALSSLTGRPDAVDVTVTAVLADGSMVDVSDDKSLELSTSQSTLRARGNTLVLKRGSDPMRATITARMGEVTATTVLDVLAPRAVTASVSDDVLQAIADYPAPGRLQSATVTVLATWMDQAGATFDTDVTDQVTVVAGAGLKWDAQHRRLEGVSAGKRVFRVLGAGKTILARGSVRVDPSTSARIRALQVVAPCHVQSLTQPTADASGRLVAAFGVSALIDEYDETCQAEVVAHFEDGTTMPITGDRNVVLTSTDPSVLTAAAGGRLAGLATGRSRVRATLVDAGRTVATGSSEVDVALPGAVALTIEPAAVTLSSSAVDPAATMRGLPVAQTMTVTVHYADGSTAVRSPRASGLKWQVTGTAATVNGVGRVSAAMAGTAQVSVTAGGLTANATVAVVKTIGVQADVYEPMAEVGERVVDRTLNRIEGTRSFQWAALGTRLLFSDGATIDVLNHSQTRIAVVTPGGYGVRHDVISLDARTGAVAALKPGVVDIIAKSAGYETRVESVTVSEQAVDVISLAAGVENSSATVAGISDHVSGSLAVDAVFADGTRASLAAGGVLAVPGLLRFQSTVPEAATITDGGVITTRANRSTVLSVDLEPAADRGEALAVASETPIDVNLLPGPGDLDLGDMVGLAFKDRQPQDAFTLQARLNTDGQALGAFDVELTYDPQVLEITGVHVAEGLPVAMFSTNRESQPGTLFVNAALNPNAPAVTRSAVPGFKVS